MSTALAVIGVMLVMSTATISRGLRVAGYEARAIPAKEGLRMSDVAQRMWKPMTAMGVMVIAAGLVLGIVSATHANVRFRFMKLRGR